MPEGIWFAFNCFNSECIAGSHQFIHLMSHIRLSLELLVIQGKHLSKLKPGPDALFFYFHSRRFLILGNLLKRCKKKKNTKVTSCGHENTDNQKLEDCDQLEFIYLKANIEMISRVLLWNLFHVSWKDLKNNLVSNTF